MIPWLQANAAAVLSAAVVAWLSYALLRAAFASRRGDRPSATEDFSRSERVRQQVRRKIAERRSRPTSPAAADVPPPPSLPRVPPVDPFGGPLRRFWHALQRWLGRRGDHRSP